MRLNNIRRFVAVLLVAGGIISILYGEITYTKKTHEAKLGDLVLQWKEKKTVNFPVWAGAGAILLGAVMFAWEGKGRARSDSPNTNPTGPH